MKDLKQRAIRGGFARLCAQALNFGLRLGSLALMARLLEPADFGLVGMVMAVIGVLSLFRDFGLSTATVQQRTVTNEQVSTLFWVNMLVGALLALLALAVAPLVAAFYGEPRLIWVTVALAPVFLLNAAGVQHSALLQRDMRFTVSSVIDVVSLMVSSAVGVGMALRGCGYWALVATALLGPLVSTIAVWLVTAWIPGRPQRHSGLRSMLHFGGTITLNGLVVYVAYNLEKVLLGRYWGADTLGIYGRAYQLANVPTENLNSSIGGVAFSALSRLQDDAPRLKSYFLKGYSLVLALTLPITIVSALFAEDLIAVLLGPKWREVVPIFRLLAPTILISAMMSPFSWLLFSIGRVGRSLKIALVIAPLVIVGYVLGLPYGPRGVAFGYSAAMALWLVPHILWCTHDTAISFRDILLALGRPLLSAGVGVPLALALQMAFGRSLSPLPRLVAGGALFFGVYSAVLFYGMGQRQFYVDLFQGLTSRAAAEPGKVAGA
jgi:PST family polysaccharide transporter